MHETMGAGPAAATLHEPASGGGGSGDGADMIPQQRGFAPVPRYPVRAGRMPSTVADGDAAAALPATGGVLPYLRRTQGQRQRPAGWSRVVGADQEPTLCPPIRPLRRSAQGAPQGRGDQLMIRRRVSVRGHPTDLQDGKFSDEAEKLLEAVDAATEKAYNQVISRPLFTGLEDLAGTDGHIGHWIERVTEELDGSPGAMTAAQFGYAIEALATHLLGSNAAGWALTYQVAAGSTRPDIVAKKDKVVMWVDLTADPSAFHIYTLKRWNYPTVCQFPHAEVTYKPLDGGTRSVLLKSGLAERTGKPNASVVDSAALQQEVAQARQRLAANKARWRKQYSQKLRTGLRTVRDYSVEDGATADSRARNGVFRWLNETFRTAEPFTLDPLTGGGGPRRQPTHTNVTLSAYGRPRARSYSRVQPESDQDGEARQIAEREARQKETEQARLGGSILEVLGLRSGDYGLWFASVSQARGIAFLQEHDPDAQGTAV